MKANQDIREAMRANRLYSYQVADKVGVSEFTFTRWLRFELPEQKKERIFSAIRELVHDG